MACLLATTLFATLALAEESVRRHWTSYDYPPSFEHISVEQGLSQSTVRSIIQDRRGFLWFGTEAGLNRFDGFRFQVFHPESNNPNSLSGNWISHLMEDRRGYIWIATRNGGITILDPETMVMVPIQVSTEAGGLPSKTVNATAEDREGNVWLATNNGLCMVPGQWKMPGKPRFQTFQTAPQDPKGGPSGGVNGIYCDRKGTIWIGYRQGGLARLVSNPGNGKLVLDVFDFDPTHPDTSPPSAIYTIHEDAFGQLWLGGQTGLFTFDPAKGRFLRWKNPEGGSINLEDNRVLGILRDSTGTMWVASDGAGLLKAAPRLHPQDPIRFQQYARDAKDSHSLSGNGLQCLFEDRCGVLWISAYQRGLNKLVLHPGRNQNRESPSVFQFRNNAADAFSLSGDTVSTLGEDQYGNLWVGTDGYGLHRVRPPLPGQPMRFERFRADPRRGPGRLQSDVILATHLDPQQQLWLGTYNAGLVRVQQQAATAQPTFTHFRNDPKDPSSLKNNSVRCIIDDGAGGFWVALGGGGFNHFDPRTGKAKRYGWGIGPKVSSSEWIYSIVKDAFGTIWIATSAGLNRFNPATEEFRVYKAGGPHSLSATYANTLYLDGTGALWVGTRGGGLNRSIIPPWDGPQPEFQAFGISEGLPGDEIKGILPDGKGNLWISTSRALCRFHIQEGKAYPLPWQSELRKAEFVWNACFRSPGGEFFFGSNDGLTLFHPEDITPNKLAPPIAITGFQIHNKPLSLWDRATRRDQRDGYQGISLTPKDSIFSFDFAALHFVAPEQNQYAYMMEGLDKDWNEVGNKHSVSYTTLPPGEYVLRVKGSNCDGFWNEEGLRLKILVLPPWYKTWWLRTLLVGLLLCLVYAIIRIRLQVLHQRNRLLKQLVDERTQALAIANENLADANNNLAQANDNLAQANVALRNQSLTDPLTGLRNRRFLDACMPEDIAHVQRQQRDVAVNAIDRMKLNIDVFFIMVDVDHFKLVNDRHGHHAGDLVLQQLSDILRSAMRESDTITRWGGEEFLIVARNAARTDATIPPERIRAAVEAHAFDIGEDQPIHCTCSVGFSVFPLLPNEMGLFSWEKIVEIADACLYAAKQNGRNAWVGIVPDTSGLNEPARNIIPGNVSELLKAQLFTTLTSLKTQIRWDLKE